MWLFYLCLNFVVLTSNYHQCIMISITSNSIDEINRIYRRLKEDYNAKEPVKLEEDSLKYRLDLELVKLNPIVQNLTDKVLELCDEIQNLPQVNIKTFQEFMDSHATRYIFVKQLKDAFVSLQQEEQELVIDYIHQHVKPIERPAFLPMTPSLR